MMKHSPHSLAGRSFWRRCSSIGIRREKSGRQDSKGATSRSRGALSARTELHPESIEVQITKFTSTAKKARKIKLSLEVFWKLNSLTVNNGINSISAKITTML